MEWKEFFEETAKVEAAVDFPAARFYREILSVYPNAKVILTLRSKAENWYESYKNSIYKVQIERDSAFPTQKIVFGHLEGSKSLVSAAVCNSIPNGFQVGCHQAGRARQGARVVRKIVLERYAVNTNGT